MATRFDIDTFEEFETLFTTKKPEISEAFVETILKNLKGKKRYVHALSIVCNSDGEVYDVTIDREDFLPTLKQNLITYEEEERYEDCIKIQKALKYLKKKKNVKPRKTRRNKRTNS